jgi:hypothetical protein
MPCTCSQGSFKATGPAGVDTVRESIYITHIGTDEDGSLKIKRVEEFTDSQLFISLKQAAARAKSSA